MSDFQHGINAELAFTTPALTLTGEVESATHDLQRELAEIRVWGEDSVIRVPGLRNCNFTANGAWTADLDAALFDAWNGDTPVTVSFQPDGVVTYTFDAFIASYSQTHGSGDNSTWNITLNSSGDIQRA